jgi:hypothetical protein
MNPFCDGIFFVYVDKEAEAGQSIEFDGQGGGQ